MAPRRARDVRADAELSFEQLYRGHRGDVYRAALRELGNAHDAEDVTQAAFVDAYRAVLRGTRPESPRAWLLAIAENVRRRRFRTSLSRPREEPLDADFALARDDSNEHAAALLEALAVLPTEQRQAFLLREVRGFSYDEIARRTDSTVASVQMLLFRARKTLRDELEPPQVRAAFFPLATLLSRAEAFSLTPRVAGAVGAAVVAVSVSSSVPARADSPAAKAAARAVATVSAAATPIAAAPANQTPAARPAPGKRQLVRAAPVAARSTPRPVAVAATPELQSDQSEPQPHSAEPQAQPQSEPQPAAAPQAQPSSLPLPQTLPLPQIVTPPAIPLSPAVSTPSVPPPPPLEPVIEPVLEGAGAAGAAGASAPPLPDLPLDPLPPVLP